MTKLLRSALLVILFVTAIWAQQPERNNNPVIRGDRPDPSVIRVGDTYWATTTSGSWEPGFPIFKSSDLLRWQVAGAVFQHAPGWMIGSFWAPEITSHGGRFFVYYTGRRTDGRLCVAVATAPAPAGPYTDHGPLVCQDVGSIDAMAVTDEQTGARYLVWKEDGNDRCEETPAGKRCVATVNWGQRLSDDGLKLVGKAEELIRNDTKTWEGHVVEGAFILKRNGWFYLFYSGSTCCERQCKYALGVARSRTVLGKYDKYPGNPILKDSKQWQCPGHGSIVTDTKDRDFLLYHAWGNYPSGFFIGREALLAEVSWGVDGWPRINPGREPEEVKEPRAEPLEDEFSEAKLKPTWQWPSFQRPSVTIDEGWLMLAPAGDHQDDELGAVLAQPVTSGSFVATTLLDTTLFKLGSAAGLAVYHDRDRAVGITVRHRTVSTYDRKEKEARSICENDFKASRIHLRMTATNGLHVQFEFSEDGKDWKNCGNKIELGDFREARIALTAGGEWKGAAKFDWFRVTP